MQYTTPLQGLTLVDSEKVNKPFVLNQKEGNALAPYLKTEEKVKGQDG